VYHGNPKAGSRDWPLLAAIYRSGNISQVLRCRKLSTSLPKKLPATFSKMTEAARCKPHS
jgi:hypothetical protein